MSDSPVSGIAGSARILKLTPHLLRKMERHGKREDETSKARVINDEPPLTTTGLDLEALYLAHIDGAYIPKAKSVAIELLLQFPADLVDGEDPEYLLKHTRAFAETVWGPEAIFADRVDRDEKGRENVSVYVTPKYVKKTKHTERMAVSMTRDLKRLAQKHGRKEHKWDIGRALQDAAFDYFKDVMELEGVQRGHGKVRAGKDWESAERLREKELNSIRAALEAEQREVEAKHKDAAEKQEQADRALLAAAALEKRKLELNRQAEAELALIIHDGEMQQAAAAAINAEIATAKAEAAADRKAASDAARAAAVDRELAAADRAKAAAERAALATEKSQVAENQALVQRQLELIARGADERNGLNLRREREGFAMYRERLSPSEQSTYDSKWPSAMVAIARSVARILEQARDLLQGVMLREKAVEERENVARVDTAQLKRAQAAHQAAVNAHQVAQNNLNIRLAKLETDEARLAEDQRKAAVAIASAQKRELEAEAIEQVNEQWVKVVNALAPFAGKVTVGADNKLVVDDPLKPLLPPSVASSLTAPAPVWVTKIIAAQKAADELEKRAKLAEVRQREAEAVVIADRKRIERSRSILEAIATDRCTASVGNEELHLTHTENGKAIRTEKVALADLESSVVYLVRLHAKMLEGDDKISKLERELRVERASLAQRYPDRAPALHEEQKAVERKIQRAFDPNQVPPSGMGF